MQHEDHLLHHDMKSKAKAYQPLIIIIMMILLATVALQSLILGAGMFTFMHVFMGLFFIIFAMFKFFDLEGFADGFQMYDILARRERHYAYAYPFIEAGLGVFYLSGAFPLFTYLATFIVMAISAVGVLRGVFSGKHITCACLGKALNVPLSTVSVIENVGMGIMAIFMLLRF